MNERIKELAHEAGLPTYNPGGIPTKLEKFAELIVQQCGYYADVFEALGCPVDMDPAETKPSDYIKRHLGVE